MTLLFLKFYLLKNLKAQYKTYRSLYVARFAMPFLYWILIEFDGESSEISRFLSYFLTKRPSDSFDELPKGLYLINYLIKLTQNYAK